MATYKILDETGLARVWAKMKAYVTSQLSDIPSGGGSSGLALNISIEGSTYTLDKTVSEIVEALNSGISPVFVITSDDGKKSYFPLKNVSHIPSSWYIEIASTAYSDVHDVFKATGANAYPSFTRSGGGGND